ncbi:RRP15-like protein isoform X1 [Anastrepha obliqua]|uniref:RRP15-like protein isoform X1 n=1 Tax=Anastrepha obliqua TaxID=95512 RepID=UPI0024094D0D|nr:RRP15-like protein isoform X1 [Anastrepha obliqua]
MALYGVKKGNKEKSGFPTAHGSDDSEAEYSRDESENDAEGNAGWADCIAKVLNTSKPKTKKTLVLSRAKKVKPDDKAKTKSVDYGFEVEGEQTVDEKPIKKEVDEKIKRKNVHLELRVKPSWRDIERERTLRKVATRGVVQLFNAVRIQQKNIQVQLDAAGPLDSRKEAVLNNINKRKFLDVLMSGSRAKSEAVDNPVKSENMKAEDNSEDEENSSSDPRKRKSEWSVLREDFMTNKKIKHWDEEDDEENDETLNNDTSEESDDEK